MRYSLRTLVVLMLAAPPIFAYAWWASLALPEIGAMFFCVGVLAFITPFLAAGGALMSRLFSWLFP